MSTNDWVGWAGLVLAVLGFPAVYAPLSRIGKRIRRRLEECDFSPRIETEWVGDGTSRQIRITNVEDRTMKKVAAVFDITSPDLSAGRTLRPGQSFVLDASAADPAIPDSDHWLNVGWRGFGRSYPPQWWERLARRTVHDGMTFDQITTDGPTGLDARRAAWPGRTY